MKWSWLLTAVALAACLLARRRKLGRLELGAGVLATAGAVLIGTGVDRPAEHREADRGRRARGSGRWTYLLVGVLAFLETGAFIGLVAPGETAVLVGGLVAGQGQISLLVLIAIVWTCAVLGDLTSYTLGRRLGRAWLLRHGERLKITEERLHQVERFLDKRGGLTILDRPLHRPRARARAVHRRHVADAAARASCPTTCSAPGRGRRRSASSATCSGARSTSSRQYVSRGLFAFGTRRRARSSRSYVLVRLRRRPGAAREGPRRGSTSARDQPCWRPLARLAAPVVALARPPGGRRLDATARFGLHRLTPGNLGLELTTLLALAAVGAFSFFLIGALIQEQPACRGSTASRSTSPTGCASSRSSTIAKVVTHLGSSPVIGAARARSRRSGRCDRRRWIDAARSSAGCAARPRRRARHQGRLRPPAAAGRARRHGALRLSLRPRGLRGRADRLRRRCSCARASAGRCASRSLTVAVALVAVVALTPRLPARALPHRRARRRRAGRRDLVARRHRRAVRRGRSSQWRPIVTTTTRSPTPSPAPPRSSRWSRGSR